MGAATRASHRKTRPLPVSQQLCSAQELATAEVVGVVCVVLTYHQHRSLAPKSTQKTPPLQGTQGTMRSLSAITLVISGPSAAPARTTKEAHEQTKEGAGRAGRT